MLGGFLEGMVGLICSHYYIMKIQGCLDHTFCRDTSTVFQCFLLRVFELRQKKTTPTLSETFAKILDVQFLLTSFSKYVN